MQSLNCPTLVQISSLDENCKGCPSGVTPHILGILIYAVNGLINVSQSSFGSINYGNSQLYLRTRHTLHVIVASDNYTECTEYIRYIIRR